MTATLSATELDAADAFVRVAKDGVVMTLRRDYAEGLSELGIDDPRKLAKLDGCVQLAGGRGGVFSVPFGDERLVVRHSRRGGLFGRLLGDLYLGRGRALREMRVSHAAEAAGVATPRIVAVVQRGALGVLCRSDVISVEVSDGITAGEYLGWFPATTTPEVLREKRQIIDAVAKAVRRMHDAGLHHGDLNVNNLLLRRGGAMVEVHVLDLDGSRMRRRVSPARRRRELMRLNRSMMKMQLDPCPVTDEDRLRFLRSYGHDALDVEPRRLLKLCRRQVSRHSLLWHWRRT